jgi:hypothetical protein
MTYRIYATNDGVREHVGRVCLGGVIGPDFDNRDSAERHAAVWAVGRAGWEWEVVPWERK